jgi:hypothetical protein
MSSPLRILHVGEDSLFLSRFSAWFEQTAPGSSSYVVMTQPGRAELRFPIEAARVDVVVSRAPGLRLLVRAVRTADVVVVHSMGLFGSIAAIAARRGAKLMWSGFGGDYYGDRSSRDTGLLGPQTMAVRRALEPSASPARRIDAALRDAAKRRAARRADYFSAPIAADLEVFRRRFPSFSGSYLQLNYATLSDMDSGAGRTPGRDILVGNSASYANNHLEVFDMLARVDLTGRRVITPLSYGESESYKDLVIQAGRARFGERFVALTDYLPLDEYIDLVASCGHVVMGHRRQQALGNIVAALCAGADIVLDERNPIVRTLRQEGAHIRTLGELEREGFDPLPSHTDENRRVAERLWGDDVVRANIASFVERITTELGAGTVSR